jgi:hypothetical protein
VRGIAKRLGHEGCLSAWAILETASGFQADPDGKQRTEERRWMPQKKPLRGVGEKEQRQYEHIKESAKEEDRYKGREEEVAARTVMKQHGEKGHRKGE